MSEWRRFSSNPWIFGVIHGEVLHFDSAPVQSHIPPKLYLSQADQAGLDRAMQQFIHHKIVEPCSPVPGPCFYSNIFPRIKPDGSSRVILNLKVLNLHMDKVHFKMDTLRDVLHLVSPGCFFATVDFKHAYYSVPVCPQERSWLRFIWNTQHYQFTCLPQGLSSAPRIFTKLLKPILAHFRSLGITVSCYIDDCIFIADTPHQLSKNVKYAVHVFDRLGLTLHPAKSVLHPSQSIEFLGFILDSLAMTVTLASRKKHKIHTMATSLIRKRHVSIRELSALIGNLVAAEPGVPLAPLRYKQLEIVRNEALSLHKGNFDSTLTLSHRAVTTMHWWITNIHSQTKSLICPPPSHELFTDASLEGWGAKLGHMSTGGQWAASESDHINILELKAVLFGLKALCTDLSNTHIRIRTDNTTAVACISRTCSIKPLLLQVTEDIYHWAACRHIELSATHVKGSDNVDADFASRTFNSDTEWMLLPHIFHILCSHFTLPYLDLFATRINCQLPLYVSWRPDPEAYAVDAFTLSWSGKLNYAFPPFSLIGRCLQKLHRDKATVLCILPLWPTRPWFPRALQLLADTPRLLPPRCLQLPQDPTQEHRLAGKLVLAAMILSGLPSHNMAYRRNLLPSSCPLGGRVPANNMGAISAGGCHFVSNDQMIHFAPL